MFICRMTFFMRKNSGASEGPHISRADEAVIVVAVNVEAIVEQEADDTFKQENRTYQPNQIMLAMP